MDNKFIWSYFMELSNHIADDANTLGRFWYTPPRFNECNGVDVEVWDETIKFIADRGFNTCVIEVGDAVLYDSHPEISAPDAWSKDFLKKKLDEMRALGIEPIPKLNFSMTHTCWMKHYRRMPSTPKYYEVCANLIAEICELFGNPRLFHLGMDEETIWDQQFREMCIVRHEKLWWHDLFFLFKECEKHGARPWIWADYFWEHPDLFAERMPKSIMLSNWFYANYKKHDNYNVERLAAYEKLNDLGYDQIPCSSTWGNQTNPFEQMVHSKKFISDDLLKGYLIAPWAYAIDRDTEFYHKNCAHTFYIARKKVYPESL